MINNIVPNNILLKLKSKSDLLIGYSLNESPIEYNEQIYSNYYDIIKYISNLPIDERRELYKTAIIYKHIISPKDTTYEDEYNACKGEIIETEEYMYFDNKSKQWKK